MAGYIDIACGVAVIGVLLYYYLMSNYNFWKIRGVTGPKPIPGFGNIKNVLFGTQAFSDLIKGYYDQYKQEGMFGIFLRRMPYLVLTDPELIKDVLIKDFSNFADRGIAFFEKGEPLSAHLFNLEPKRWRPLRTRLSPIFTSGKLKDMFGMISECSEHFEKMVAQVAEKGEPVEVRDLTARFTTDVIGTCAFGIDTKALAAEDSEFRRMGVKIFEPTGMNAVRFRLRQFLPTIYKLVGFFMVEKELTNFFTSVTVDMMKHRRKNNIYRNDFINTLMELEDHPEKLGDLKLTERLTVAQAFVFFAAGFETSSTTMSNALYELALNQDVQSKLREEIKETYLNKEGNNLDYETIKKMEYLDAIFRETLRKYPPVTNLNRKAQNSYTFEGTKITIPKGQDILIPAYAIQHDPDIYPNPDVFDPDRFRYGGAETRHPMHYLPFGDGPRNCIGARFAVHQTKVGLIKMIRKYQIDVCEKTPIPYVIHPKAFLLAPLDGIYLQISKCEGS